MSPPDVQLVEQGDDVVAHPAAETGGVGQLAALSEAPLVEHDHPVIASQRIGEVAHVFESRRVPVQEDDRLASTDFPVPEPYPVGSEEAVRGGGKPRRGGSDDGGGGG